MGASGAERCADTVTDYEVTLLRKVLDGVPAMIAYWDRDQRNVVANAAYVEWFGLRPDQMRGIHISKVLGDDVYRMNLPYITGALRGEPQLFQRTLVDTAHRTRHTQASYVPDVDPAGDVRGFFVLVTDITERVEAERAMAEAQRIGRMGSFTWEARTGAVEWSAEMFRLVGVVPGQESPSAELYLALIHPDDRPRLQQAFENAQVRGEGYELGYRLVRPDGSLRYLYSRTTAECTAEGEVLRLTGIVQDITDSELARQELVTANAALDRANQLYGDLVAMLSHDARQPVALVRVILESMLRHWSAATDDEKLADLEQAVTVTCDLGRLFDDMLAVTRLASGTLNATVQPTSVSRVVADSLALVPPALDVKIDVPEQLTVLATPWQLRQMLTNLIGNAGKYGLPPIEVSADRVGDRVEISVTDHGPGVPPDLVPTLFQRYAPADHRGQHGAGFGLYIVERLAEANAGTVTYRFVPPTGSRFTITVPAADTP